MGAHPRHPGVHAFLLLFRRGVLHHLFECGAGRHIQNHEFLHWHPPLAALCAVARRSADDIRQSVLTTPAKSIGAGPPQAQSSSSAVWTIGIDVPSAICVMQPILPAAMMSGFTRAILAALRARRRPAISGCRILYVPAEPQQIWPSGTSRTTKPARRNRFFGSIVIFCPCCIEQAE